MPSKSKTITADIVQELRTLFRREYEQNPPDAPFHPTDMERIEKSDKWLARFLRTYELDVEQSFQKLWETCIWRQTYGANDLSELNLRHDYLQLPIVFAHNYDIDGYPLLIFQCRYHTSGSKDMDAFMRCVVYWIERVHRTHDMSKISLIFDLSDTGLKSVDMDFVVRVMNLFKVYYPSAINLIIIYEIPWVLNAAFSLVKRLLSANALEVLRVCTKKDITKFIDKDNCLANWGGNDNYEYVYLPEKRQMNESIIQVTISEDNTLKSTNSADNIVKHIYQNNQTWIKNPSDKYNDNNYKNTLDKNVPEGGSNTEIIAKSLNDVQSLQSSEEVSASCRYKNTIA